MMKRWFICALMLSLIAVLLAGCGGSSFTDEEISTAAEKLLQESVGINEIYFGKGLPAVETGSPAADAFAAEVKTDATMLSYIPVDTSAGYASIESIKAATEKVYSQSYCQHLYELAFSGISTEEGTALFARYMETEGGTLAVHKKLSAIDTRTYSMEGGAPQVEILKKSGNTAVARAQSYLNGEKDVFVEIQLIYENGAWRLDNPTY